MQLYGLSFCVFILPNGFSYICLFVGGAGLELYTLINND